MKNMIISGKIALTAAIILLCIILQNWFALFGWIVVLIYEIEEAVGDKDLK